MGNYAGFIFIRPFGALLLVQGKITLRAGAGRAGCRSASTILAAYNQAIPTGCWV